MVFWICHWDNYRTNINPRYLTELKTARGSKSCNFRPLKIRNIPRQRQSGLPSGWWVVVMRYSMVYERQQCCIAPPSNIESFLFSFISFSLFGVPVRNVTTNNVFCFEVCFFSPSRSKPSYHYKKLDEVFECLCVCMWLRSAVASHSHSFICFFIASPFPPS